MFLLYYVMCATVRVTWDGKTFYYLRMLGRRREGNTITTVLCAFYYKESLLGPLAVGWYYSYIVNAVAPFHPVSDVLSLKLVLLIAT